MKNSNPPYSRTAPPQIVRRGLSLLLLGLCSICLGLPGCSEQSPSEAEIEADAEDAQIEQMVGSEELVLKLTPLLRSVGQSMVSGSRDDLPEAVAGDASIAPWEGLDPDHHWKSASFGTLSANFDDDTFVMKTKFEGVRRGDDGEIVGVKAKQKFIWKQDKSGHWQLAKWKPLSFETDFSEEPLFEEVLDTVLTQPDAIRKARRSYHEEVLTKTFAGQTAEIGHYKIQSTSDIESTYSYPTVSVVDFDSDGHEDLFITSRWLAPQLLRNRGNGIFDDVTEQSGLTVENYINFAIFADFDNDGDPDALVGRTKAPALYYRNDEGVFTDVTKTHSDLGRQLFVSSAAVADVNRDGLLDVYLSTYNPSPHVLTPETRQRVFSPEQIAKLESIESTPGSQYKREGESAFNPETTPHRYLNEGGMANVLLINRGGGRLERAGGEAVELWRKSYQPLWFDADGDGDDDLYVCNDFAPDSFLRNDTPRGAAEPVFVDAFTQMFPEGQMAFGMGASAGDYDNDGDLDLFISNMYSKAGNRIIAQLDNVDERFLVAARGNFLYRNDGGVFKQVAQADAPETKVGWAFGGQFADFDNDGWLDLYVPSGLYTAPKSAATEVDL